MPKEIPIPDQPTFDLVAAHKYFAADRYNKTWGFMDNPNRTPEEDLSMLHTAMASLWRWSQREDATPINFSIGYWQVARVFALLGQPDNARCYGEMSPKAAQGGEPFYIGYAYESLARAEMVAGNKAKMNEYLAQARSFAEKMEDEEDKQVLVKDLETIK